jgi:imidazolonepropionase
MLKVLKNMEKKHSIEIVSNYLGGHSIPKKEMNLKEYTNDIINNQIPKIIELKKEGLISPEFIDVFHEKNVFEFEETKDILLEGKKNGLLINFHGFYFL